MVRVGGRLGARLVAVGLLPVLGLGAGWAGELTQEASIPVHLIADGTVRQVRTVARTPEDVLRTIGLRLGPRDRVYPPFGTILRPGDRVRVVRIREERVVRREVVPFPTERRVIPSLVALPARVLRPGREGLVESVYRVLRVDGRVVRTERLSHRILRPPQPQILRVGLGYVPSRGELARSPSALVVASAYAPYGDRGVDGVAATGIRARRGVVAVDPRVIPFGTLLYVEGYGIGIAADTGSAIRGWRIDLCFNTVREALRWGRRRVRIWVLRR
jgi:3D (Asp-Asp-Asp) domain-containing protein